MVDKSKDQDRSKGATEQDEHNQGGNMSTDGQLGHRDQHPDLKDADTDFPEQHRSPLLGACRPAEGRSPADFEGAAGNYA